MQADLSHRRAVTTEEGEQFAKVWRSVCHKRASIFCTLCAQLTPQPYARTARTLTSLCPLIHSRQEHGLVFLETSAKTALNVEEAFINTGEAGSARRPACCQTHY